MAMDGARGGSLDSGGDIPPAGHDSGGVCLPQGHSTF